jgi:hypothetical protein
MERWSQFPAKQFQRLTYNGSLLHWSTTNLQEKNTLELSANSTVVVSRELDPRDKPLFLYPFGEELMLVYHRVDEEKISYHLDYLQKNRLISKVLPGNLRITKCLVTRDRHLLYTNKFDKRLFRLIPHVMDENVSIPGPLSTEYPGRILTYAYLRSDDEKHRILTVQYLPYDKSVVFQVSVSIFTFSGGIWSREVLWETDLVGLGGDMIDSDSVDYLYFLTNPLLAVSDNEDLVAFVFIEHLFTLSKNQDNDYVLKTQLIGGLFGSDFDVDHIQISRHDKVTLLSVVSEVFMIHLVK